MKDWKDSNAQQGSKPQQQPGNKPHTNEGDKNHPKNPKKDGSSINRPL
jgi:hypothetical protein